MSNITVGRILLLDLVFLVNSALTLVVFKFVGLLDVMTTPALFFRRYLPKVERNVLAGSVAAIDYSESTVGPHTAGHTMKRSCL